MRLTAAANFACRHTKYIKIHIMAISVFLIQIKIKHRKWNGNYGENGYRLGAYEFVMRSNIFLVERKRYFLLSHLLAGVCMSIICCIALLFFSSVLWRNRLNSKGRNKAVGGTYKVPKMCLNSYLYGGEIKNLR